MCATNFGRIEPQFFFTAIGISIPGGRGSASSREPRFENSMNWQAADFLKKLLLFFSFWAPLLWPKVNITAFAHEKDHLCLPSSGL